MMRTSTIVAVSAGTIVTGLLAYAIYFDYKRQSDPEFRRTLKRNNRRVARAAKQEHEAYSQQKMDAIRQAVEEAKAEGVPSDIEERESFFMSEVARGETMCADPANHIEAALSFYKALKVYPTPQDLIGIYDRTVPKEVLEILAEMVAMDKSLKLGAFNAADNANAQGVE